MLNPRLVPVGASRARNVRHVGRRAEIRAMAIVSIAGIRVGKKKRGEEEHLAYLHYRNSHARL